MKTIKSPATMSAAVKKARIAGGSNLTVGLVPTLGCLHNGHAALIKQAKKECDLVAVSIFVNPLQFRKKAFELYPRTLEADKKMVASLGVDLLFAPSVDRMYPDGYDTFVEIKDLTGRLEGGRIRWHYRGVLTVVAKLFGIVRPDRAYFGKKDPHQLALIERMNNDLHLGVRLRPVATRRAPDGLALSSRNTLLSPAERKAAMVINRSIRAVEAKIKEGAKDRAALARLLKESIEKEPLAKVDYCAVVDQKSLTEEGRSGRTLIYAAVFVGPWRLTDNVTVKDR